MESEGLFKNENVSLLQKLNETRICTYTEVPPEQNALEVGGYGFYTLRDVHGVKGKQKCGKTTLIKVLIAALLKGAIFRIRSLLMKPRVLYFDTEQSRTDSKHILEDVAQMTGLSSEIIDSQVALYSLRRCDREQLMPLLRLAIEAEKPSVAFLDGLVDFVDSFNSESESKQILKDLLALSEEFNCAIVCVLHTNKAEDDHNMRGHLGTMLAQKAGTVLDCKKDGDIIHVSCSDSRHATVPEWNIMYDDDGRIVDADEHYKKLLEERRQENERNRKAAKEAEKQERLHKCLCAIRDNGGAMSRKDLTENLTVAFNRDRTTVASYITQWLKDNAIVETNGIIQAAKNMAEPF